MRGCLAWWERVWDSEEEARGSVLQASGAHPWDQLLAMRGQLPGDGGWFLQVNSFARHTGWLHPPLVAFAEYGVVLFAVLLLASWWRARGTGDVSRVAASLWAPLGALGHWA